MVRILFIDIVDMVVIRAYLPLNKREKVSNCDMYLSTISGLFDLITGMIVLYLNYYYGSKSKKIDIYRR